MSAMLVQVLVTPCMRENEIMSNRTTKNENSAALNVAPEPLYTHQEVVVSFV